MKNFVLLTILSFFALPAFAESHAVLHAQDSSSPSSRNGALNIDYGFTNLYNYQFTQTDSTFDKPIHSISVSPEWIMFNSVGKLAFGTSVMGAWISRVQTTQGIATLEFLEVEPYLAYRLDYFHKQLLVPFLKVGPSGAWSRQTGAAERNSSYYTVKMNVGLELLLNGLDGATARSLDQSTGIHATYLNVEAVGTFHRSDAYKPQDNLANGGLRLGLRFEF